MLFDDLFLNNYYASRIRKSRLEDAISITPYIRSEAEDVRGGQTLTKTASGRRYLVYQGS